MKDLLARQQRPLLRAFAQARSAIVLDFDGTLAPIVSDRSAARMSARTTALLRGIATRYAIAVLSGRAQDDVAARLADANVRYVVGNHGAEWHTTQSSGARIAERVGAWHAALRERLAGADGVEIENKRYSLAIHYRHAHDRADAHSLIRLALRDLRGLRVEDGKLVVNVLADSAPDKGAALDRLYRLMRCERLLYIGDDANDEPAFARGDGDKILTVRVGLLRGSSAGFYLRARSGVDELLDVLYRLRRGTVDVHAIDYATRPNSSARSTSMARSSRSTASVSRRMSVVSRRACTPKRNGRGTRRP
jgi:trehalose 6-phosphate phosphatase